MNRQPGLTMCMLGLIGCVLCALGTVAETQTNPYYANYGNRFVNEAMGRTDAQNQDANLPHHLFFLTWGYTSANSARRNDASILPRIVTLWNHIAAGYSADRNFPGSDVWSYVPFMESLRMLDPVAGIPQATKDSWKAAMRSRIDAEYTVYGDLSKSAQTGAGRYPNWDAQHVTMFYLAYLLWGDQKFKDTATQFLNSLSNNLRGGGAFSYYDGSTPVPMYHSFEVLFIGRYWQLSGDQAARTILQKTVHYYPYTWTPEDTAEYSSAPWWKQMWNTRYGGAYNGVEFAAATSRDGANRWLADLRIKYATPCYWTIYCGDARHPTVAAAPLPDNFARLDPNVDGLRGRFGRFSWVGSRGKYTASFAGCMVANSSLPNSFDGYLQLAHLGIVVPQTSGPYYQTLRLASDPATAPTAGASVVGSDYAGHAVSFVPCLYTFPGRTASAYDDWQIVQIWLYTADNVVGFLQATALKDAVTTVPQGILRLGPFARPWAYHNGLFNVGDLQGRILQHNFAQISTRDGESDPNESEQRREIRLLAKGGTFQKGQTYWYAVQFAPGTNPPAAVTVTKRAGATELLDIQISANLYHMSYDQAAGTLRITRRPADPIPPQTRTGTIQN